MIAVHFLAIILLKNAPKLTRCHLENTEEEEELCEWNAAITVSIGKFQNSGSFFFEVFLYLFMINKALLVVRRHSDEEISITHHNFIIFFKSAKYFINLFRRREKANLVLISASNWILSGFTLSLSLFFACNVKSQSNRCNHKSVLKIPLGLPLIALVVLAYDREWDWSSDSTLWVDEWKRWASYHSFSEHFIYNNYNLLISINQIPCTELVVRLMLARLGFLQWKCFTWIPSPFSLSRSSRL